MTSGDRQGASRIPPQNVSSQSSGLEGRVLMSHVGHVLPRPALLGLGPGHVTPAITTDPAGIAAIQ